MYERRRSLGRIRPVARVCRSVYLVVSVGLLAAPSASVGDPARVVGADECGECHKE